MVESFDKLQSCTFFSLVVSWSDWYSASNSQQTVNVKENVSETKVYLFFMEKTFELYWAVEASLDYEYIAFKIDCIYFIFLQVFDVGVLI